LSGKYRQKKTTIGRLKSSRKKRKGSHHGCPLGGIQRN
jgi:hypothetical protein